MHNSGTGSLLKALKPYRRAAHYPAGVTFLAI